MAKAPPIDLSSLNYTPGQLGYKYGQPFGDPRGFTASTGDDEINRFIQWLRGQPWHQQFISGTQNQGKGDLSGTERDQLTSLMQQAGVPVAQGQVEVDKAGNLSKKTFTERHPALTQALETTGLAAASFFGTPALGAALAPSIGAQAAKIVAPMLISAAGQGEQGKAPTLTGLAAGAVGGGLSTFLSPHLESALTQALGPTGAKTAANVVTQTLAGAAGGQAPTAAGLAAAGVGSTVSSFTPRITAALTAALGPDAAKIATPLVTQTLHTAARGQLPSPASLVTSGLRGATQPSGQPPSTTPGPIYGPTPPPPTAPTAQTPYQQPWQIAMHSPQALYTAPPAAQQPQNLDTMYRYWQDQFNQGAGQTG